MIPSIAAIGLGLALQERLEFRVDVNRVHIDVFVTREGAVPGRLSQESFEVYDNGARQRAELVDIASVPQTFAILLDESGSIRGNKQDLLQRAVLNFADHLRDGDELSVLSFGRRTKLRSPLGFGRPAALESAFAIRGGGLTALNDALFLTTSYLRTARGRPILVVFTDGVDNASWVDEATVLESARLSEVVVYAVEAEAALDASRSAGNLVAGGHSARSLAMLDELTRLTGGRSVESARGEAVSAAFEEILSEVSARYFLVFTPPADAQPGWHELRVKVKGVRDSGVRARAGYFLPFE